MRSRTHILRAALGIAGLLVAGCVSPEPEPPPVPDDLPEPVVEGRLELRPVSTTVQHISNQDELYEEEIWTYAYESAGDVDPSRLEKWRDGSLIQIQLSTIGPSGQAETRVWYDASGEAVRARGYEWDPVTRLPTRTIHYIDDPLTEAEPRVGYDRAFSWSADQQHLATTSTTFDESTGGVTGRGVARVFPLSGVPKKTTLVPHVFMEDGISYDAEGAIESHSWTTFDDEGYPLVSEHDFDGDGLTDVEYTHELGFDDEDRLVNTLACREGACTTGVRTLLGYSEEGVVESKKRRQVHDRSPFGEDVLYMWVEHPLGGAPWWERPEYQPSVTFGCELTVEWTVERFVSVCVNPGGYSRYVTETEQEIIELPEP